MKKTIILSLFILLTTVGFAERLAVFDDLIKPSDFALDRGQLFIIEFPHIYVYSLTDFTLIKTFGRQGEGPQEFLRFARLHFLADTFIVHSQTRFSYYSRKDFKYLKEERVPIQFDRGVRIMGDQLVVSHTVPGKKKHEQVDLTVNIYDWSFKKIKEIYRRKYYFQVNQDINVIYLPTLKQRLGIRFAVQGDKIFIEGEDGETGNIYVYNKTGEKIDTIHHEFEKLKVTDDHIQAVADWHKLNKTRIYDILKERGNLYRPRYFPAIRYLSIADNKIRIIPYKKKQGKNRLFVFNLEGKLLTETDAPFEEENLFSLAAGTIENGKVYQLKENENEKWEFHVTEMK